MVFCSRRASDHFSRWAPHRLWGRPLIRATQRFGIEIADTRTRERCLLCEDPYICNPHTQFDTVSGSWTLVQHNSGCRYAPDGTRLRLVGEDGATIFMSHTRDGDIMHLPVGQPHMTPLTRHQVWVGCMREIIVTVRLTGDVEQEKGNILCLVPGSSYRQIAPGRRMSRIAPPCGRYFAQMGT